MPVDVVFREHEVHAVAGGLVIITPLKTGAEEGKLVEQVVDDGLGSLREKAKVSNNGNQWIKSMDSD